MIFDSKLRVLCFIVQERWMYSRVIHPVDENCKTEKFGFCGVFLHVGENGRYVTVAQAASEFLNGSLSM